MGYHRLPLIQSPLGGDTKTDSLIHENPQNNTHDETLSENPQFQHYEQTSNIQLFFDLFFVANLTAFTNVHEVNSTNSLSTYIGFFTVLWFTWVQVTLYDVRFSTDSVFERLAHALHFGAMVGIGVVGPQFKQDNLTFQTAQQLSLILMANRLTLCVQYGSTLAFSWTYKKTRLPLTAVMISLATASLIYLIISIGYALQIEGFEQSYYVWFVVPVVEVAVMIAIAGRWNVLSFKGTHLTERMTCLTLIILGEGVIGLLKTIGKIESLDFDFSPATIGGIISAVLVIYFIYQLYFDNVEMEHFGNIRQQIWAFLHFPFHMALALCMEGTNEFVIWRHIVEQVNSQFTDYVDVGNNSTATVADYFVALNQTIFNVFNNFPTSGGDTTATINEVFEELQVFNSSIYANTIVFDLDNATLSTIGDAANNITTTLMKSIADAYGFEPPESADEPEGIMATLEAYFNVFNLVFVYFFVCSGIVLVGVAILSILSLGKSRIPREQEARHRWVGIIANLTFGMALILLSIMVTTDASENLGESPWTLPLLCFVLLIALVLNHIPKKTKEMGKDHPEIEKNGSRYKIQSSGLDGQRNQESEIELVMRKSHSQKVTDEVHALSV